jgi:transcriptional regulator with XRE-family HTH domain
LPDDLRVRIFLDPQPLLAEIRAWRAENTMTELSRRSGVPDRTIRRFVSGERAHVRLDVADKLASALDQPFSYLYPGGWPGEGLD